MYPTRDLLSKCLCACLLCILITPTYSQVHPSKQQFTHAIRSAYMEYKDLQEGANADYIPELSRVPSELFGISICTVEGQTYSIGDVEALFSIQSISKVFTLSMAMQELGYQAIADTIGVSATGRPFNSVTAIEDMPDRPSNSCVNAGALATTSLISGKSMEDKWDKITAVFDQFAARKLNIDQEVYESEAANNQHNQAIAQLLESYGRIYSDPKETVDLYTRQCALSVNVYDLSIMSATLANGGTNPITHQEIISPELIPYVLAIMTTAGLYEESGLWLYHVGLPGKSGVGGGVIAIVPGQFSIAAFSPRLDVSGNSVRAVKAITAISRELNVNLFSTK
ncbi:glutaminase [Reichenbachiella sp. 5M10]|uniref:glutaminase A n=1 Tax=Reichenbachiella sp. 5M10 TaxID=1889772 RepID=UPI000C1602B0|nr:glutaminase A [Reichenbachiella sp. 5M10]PIB33994.1 glutaminase [Reichenbachiella sp. 5M10]